MHSRVVTIDTSALCLAGMKASVALGSNPVGAYRELRCSIHRLQVDDQLPGSPFPVVLSSVPGSEGGAPLLALAAVEQAGTRGRSYYPAINVRWPHTLQVSGWEGVGAEEGVTLH
jgi:hypothetical protein